MRLLGNEQREIDWCSSDERRHNFRKRNQRDGWKRWRRTRLAGSAIIAAEAVLWLSLFMRRVILVGSHGVILGWLMLAKRHGNCRDAVQTQSQGKQDEKKLLEHHAPIIRMFYLRSLLWAHAVRKVYKREKNSFELPPAT